MKLRLAIAILAGFGLSACNQVISADPWFSYPDTRGAPALRDGLWVLRSEDDCVFDERLAVAAWPRCAEAVLARGDEWLPLPATGGGSVDGRAQDRMAVVLAYGDPHILQIWQTQEPSSEDYLNSAEAAVPDGGYSYFAIRPAQIGADGKVTQFRIWPIACGPLPEQGTTEREKRHVTEDPFPGLVVEGSNCTATSQAAIHFAARLSEALPDPRINSASWVREGVD